jgi:16S rRNA (guanine527-N7)-methyltransferase
VPEADGHNGRQPGSAVRRTPSEAELARVFGDRRALALRYAEILTGAGITRGLLGPREAPRIWDRHILNSAAMAPLLPEGATVCDLGSGAGLPGLVLALARPDLRMTLLEPLLRRATFLQEAVDDLGVDGVDVLRSRAEDVAPDRRWQVVVARAVAPMGRLAGWAGPLLEPGGQLLALKGTNAQQEAADAHHDLLALGASGVEVLPVGALDPDTAEQSRVVRVTFAAAPPERPRKNSKTSKSVGTRKGSR